MNATGKRALVSGWTGFAGTMMLLAGGFNVLIGLAALLNGEYLEQDLLVGNLSVFGGIAISVGVSQILIALGIFARNPLAQVLGIMFAGFSIFFHLVFIGAHPVWSVIAVVIDGLIIWALTVHGEE